MDRHESKIRILDVRGTPLHQYSKFPNMKEREGTPKEKGKDRVTVPFDLWQFYNLASSNAVRMHKADNVPAEGRYRSFLLGGAVHMLYEFPRERGSQESSEQTMAVELGVALMESLVPNIRYVQGLVTVDRNNGDIYQIFRPDFPEREPESEASFQEFLQAVDEKGLRAIRYLEQHSPVERAFLEAQWGNEHLFTRIPLTDLERRLGELGERFHLSATDVNFRPYTEFYQNDQGRQTHRR